MIAFSGFETVDISCCCVRCSIHRLMYKVMPIQIGKKGVNGSVQKSRQADAITDAHFQPNTILNKYHIHTGEYTTAITIKSRKKVLISLHSCHIYWQKRIHLSLSFKIISIHLLLSIFLNAQILVVKNSIQK